MRLNIGGALAFFAFNFVTGAVSSWAPTILTAVGLPMSNAISGSLLFNSLAIGGGLVMASLIARWGSKPLMIGSSVAGLFAVVAMGVVLHEGMASPDGIEKYLLLALVGLIGLFVAGAWTCVYMILSVAYPVSQRATGVGFSVMMGRVSSVVAVLSGGVLLKMGGTTATPLFVVLAGFTAIAAMSAFIIDRHIMPTAPVAAGAEKAEAAATTYTAAAP